MTAATRQIERGGWIQRLDRIALGGIAVGVGLMLQPWWQAGFAVGFFVTLGTTLAQIVTSHLLPSPQNS